MKLAVLSSVLLSSVLVLPAQSTTVTYNQTYDKSSNSLNTVACSNGPNGLETKGYKTFGSIPNFPYIGQAPAIKGWNSPYCGTCWKLTYAGRGGEGKGTSIYVTALDVAVEGRDEFVTGPHAMNKLTDNNAVVLNETTVTVVAKQVNKSKCGF